MVGYEANKHGVEERPRRTESQVRGLRRRRVSAVTDEVRQLEGVRSVTAAGGGSMRWHRLADGDPRVRRRGPDHLIASRA